MKPENIPYCPEQVYKDKGWKGYGDFLGTGTIRPQDIKFIPIEEAKIFVHLLKLKSCREWYKYCASGKKQTNIPSRPDRTYKNQGWSGWRDFLGRRFRKFNEAKIFVKSLNLKNVKEWKKYRKTNKKPKDIPSNPKKVYKEEGWIHWGDFLGTNRNIKSSEIKFILFEEAKKFAHSLKLKGTKEWYRYCKSMAKPMDIPARPDVQYKNKGWTNWGDFLGTGNVAPQNMKFRSFEESRKFAKSLKLKSHAELKEYCKSDNKPIDIPSNPNLVYKNKGWKGCRNFLGY